MTSKKFIIIFLISIFVIFFIISSFVIAIDPYFHYHKPLKGLVYTLDNQRYQNDGIVKHFDYDAIITGTSMTENFKASELDKLFDVHSIKVPFEGATFYEINNNLIQAMNNNKDIKLIVRCLDLYRLNDQKDALSYEVDTYPTYLYDNNIFNDVKYLLNKNIIITSIGSVSRTINNESSTTFDEYSIWYNNIKVYFSKEMVDSQYTRPKEQKIKNISDNDYKIIANNLKQNVTDLADKYPDTKFYLFYPPYSIYYWDKLKQQGTLDKNLDCIEYATKLLLKYPNIYLFSFLDEYDIITNLNNYKDLEHYSEKINSLILQKMKNNENIITNNNYEEKIKDIRNFYSSYDYNKLFDN